MGIFRVTSPSGKVGDFHQLGSIFRDRICVENLFTQTFGRDNVKYDRSFVFQKKVYLSFQNYNRKGYVYTPEGTFSVEIITSSDPRFMNTSIIKEYSEMFGEKNVEAVLLSGESSQKAAPSDLLPIFKADGKTIKGYIDPTDK